MIEDNEKEIARKYALPERPFLYGMASAFDMFGVLGRSRREQILANFQDELQANDGDTMKRVWGKVGLRLFRAIKHYEKMERDSKLL